MVSVARCEVRSTKKEVEEVEYLGKKYPSLSLLDLHYFMMKYYGMKDRLIEEGRPSSNLIDSQNLYHITFTTNEVVSPYSLENGEISYLGKEIPLRIDFVERVPVRVRRYYYIRNSSYMTPTLGDELILNLNFKHKCYNCGFCQNLVCSSQVDVSPEEGFKLVMSRGDIKNLIDFDEIAIVTGCFGSAKEASQHITKIIEISTTHGFRGRIFYIGFELSDPVLVQKIVKLAKESGLKGFRMAYTVEMFENRQRLMRGEKGQASIEEIEETLRTLKDLGIENLQYTYMPGLDNLNVFKKWAERLAHFAEPHISIYRQFDSNMKKKHVSPDYQKIGPAYLCEVRLLYQALYAKPLYGNNLGNIFPFPLSMISKKWVQERIAGNVPNLRYWANQQRPIGWRVVH